MKVYSLLCPADNYCHLLFDPATKEAALFDASDAGELIPQLEALGIAPTHLCITHHHADHIHGVAGLMENYPELQLFQPSFAPCHSSAQIVAANEAIPFAGRLIQSVQTPYHTLTSVCYHFEDFLFTGDSLFVAGCGRMFEGNKEQLYAAFQFFTSLPDETEVFVGHDYAEVNLRFALSLEPENPFVSTLLERCAKEESNEAGSRTTIGQEKQSNPFFRYSSVSIKSVIDPSQTLDEVEVMYQLRLKRNQFL